MSSIEERMDNYFESDEFNKFVESRSGDFVIESVQLLESLGGNEDVADEYLKNKGF